MAIPCSRELPSARFITGTQPVSSSATLVLPADVERRSVTVVNAGTVDIYLTPSASGSPAVGFLLVPGEGLTLNTAAAMYAVTSSGESTVKYVSETGVPEGF